MKKIEIERLHPKGVLEKARKMREEDMKYYADPATGKIRKDICEYINCYLCGRDNTELLFEKEGFDFVRCKACDLVYVNPRLSSQKVLKFYNSKRYEYQFKNLLIKSAKYRQERLYSERLDYIGSYMRTGKLLDVGCAAGHFVESAIRRNWDAYGVEVSKYAVEYARNRLKLKKIFNDTLIDIKFPSDYFDAVTCWDMLEHLTEPVANLREIHRILKSKGMIFIIVPNFDSAEVMLFGKDCDNIVADAHLIYFTPKTLQKMLEKAGFEVVFRETKGIDVDHAVFNIANVYNNKYDTQFLKDKKEILQKIIDLAGKGNFLFMFAKKKKRI
ncbi:MAG: class I SAM-dependent methyltransferase [Candidatus Omnitrophica bacterium]|nr:class I SAM-dependent methyltransferase [Candidatus Omnitrophota bacterium]